MTLSSPHASDPYHKCGIKLGDYQFERAKKWEEEGHPVPGRSGRGARHGGCICQICRRNTSLMRSRKWACAMAANLEVRGYEFAPNFSIWTTIEECLNPPVIWEKERAGSPLPHSLNRKCSSSRRGSANRKCINVEHEEVLLVPRWIKCKRVTFKYALGRPVHRCAENTAHDRSG